MNVLGVFRERQHSPNRELDDSLILKAVTSRFPAATLLTPEEFDRADAREFDLILPMCEAFPRLMRLKSLEEKTGVVVANPADSVLGCYRTRMISSFAKTPGLVYPSTAVRRTTAAANETAPAFDAPRGWWLKRGDVHNTCDRDVVFVRDWSQASPACHEFARRRIEELIVQRHIDGDLIKFYGVGPGQWFTWFYHQAARNPKEHLPFSIEELTQSAELAASAVKVSIFGGDAIVTPAGKIYIIDINSWPSFARVRNEASTQIARHLHALTNKKCPL